MKNDNADSENSALQDALDAVDACEDATNVSKMARIVAAALPNLELAEAAILSDYVRERAGISQVAARALLKDAENYRNDHGFLRTPKQVADAYLRLLEQHYLKIVLVGSSLYAYASGSEPADADEGQKTGFFERTPLKEVIDHMVDTFDDLPLLRSVRGRDEVLMHLRLRCSDEDFFVDARAGVNLRNGFLQMDKAGDVTFLPHSPDYKARMRLEIDYDPNVDTSWLDAAFALALPDLTARMVLQEVTGSIIFGVRPAKDGVRNMTILYGASGSGKSTIINMLTGLLPAEVVGSVPPEHWADPNYRAKLENVLLNIVTELGTTKLGGEHVKRIVSCEPITTRLMRRDPVVITPMARHLFAGNVLPRIADKTDAFARRIIVITFKRTLANEQVDTGLLQRVQADPNALIAFAAAGAARLLQRGVFTTPPGQELAIAEMQHGHDWHLLFAHTQVRKDPTGRVTTDAMRNALKAFVAERDPTPVPVNDGAIRKVVEVLYAKYGAIRRKSNGHPFYEGVSLVASEGDDENDATDVDLNDL
jgi:energy-coupling factor transporter ATP-binding protein EcfA2